MVFNDQSCRVTLKQSEYGALVAVMACWPESYSINNESSDPLWAASAPAFHSLLWWEHWPFCWKHCTWICIHVEGKIWCFWHAPPTRTLTLGVIEEPVFVLGDWRLWKVDSACGSFGFVMQICLPCWLCDVHLGPTDDHGAWFLVKAFFGRTQHCTGFATLHRPDAIPSKGSAHTWNQL